MLKTIGRILLGLGLIASLLIIAAAPAHADFCVKLAAGTCTYAAVIDAPGTEPCTDYGDTIPCQLGFKEGPGYWSQSLSEYVVLLPDPWVWTGLGQEATGSFAFYLNPRITGPDNGYTEGILPIRSVAPDASQLARQLVASMNLAPIVIGIVPDPVPGRVGILGFPQWMWADNPAENTTGPMTRSITQAGFTVTATATMTHIDWNMGDGSVVTCRNAGTKYEDRYGKSPSPTCGYHYTQQGTFTVTATSHWDVAWSGIGQTGTIPVSFTSTATITMGEVQVLRR